MLSRVADALYWLSRYLERAEHTARLIDVNLNQMLDQSAASAGPRWFRLQASLLPAPFEPSGPNPSGLARAIAFDLLNRGSFETCLAAARENARAIAACLAGARENARQVREQISPQMWEQINRLYLNVRSLAQDEDWQEHPHDFFRAVDEGAQLFHGITEGSMCRDEGWHFLQLGKFMERASAVAAVVDVNCGDTLEGSRNPSSPDDYLDWLGLLRSCAAFEAYCKVHTAVLRPAWIVQFLLLDREFPHSLRFSIDRMGESLAGIGDETGRRDLLAERLAGRLSATLGYSEIDEIRELGLHSFLVDVQNQLGRIQAAVHQTYVEPPLATTLTHST